MKTKLYLNFRTILEKGLYSFLGLVNVKSVVYGLEYLSWEIRSSRKKNLPNEKSPYQSNSSKKEIQPDRIFIKKISPNFKENFIMSIFFCITLFSFLFCSNNKKNGDKQRLALLLSNSLDDTKALFSYPGRYVHRDKKREVLDSILSIIENAKFSLKIYAYSFNNPEIIEALVEAKKRGVIIEITGDKEQNYDLAQENGFTINVWKQTGLHHIKVIVADNSILFTGTGNFSKKGLTNDWNGYIQFTIEEKNRNGVQEFLEEKLNVPALNTNKIQFISSPENGFLSQNLLLQRISEARISIDYLIFDHFDAVISHALKQASSRGVKVTGVYDAPVDEEGKYLSNQLYGFTSRIYKDGNEDILETTKFPEGGLLHHKSMIIDGRIVLSGSYNYSTNARDSNREILFMSENPYLAFQFQEEFNRVRDKSYPQPMNQFHVFPDRRVLEIFPISQGNLCLPQNINSPVIELGSGIWKTYLHYPKVQNTNCFYISSYAKISSGLTNGDRNDFLSLNSLWDSFQIYARDSNISYTYNAFNSDPLFHSNKRIIYKKPKYLSFTNNKIYFEMSENLELKGKQIRYWIPGKGMRVAAIEQPVSGESGYAANINTNSTERLFGAAFIETENSFYFFCYQDRTRTNKAIFDYLLKQTYLENNLQSSAEMSCLTN